MYYLGMCTCCVQTLIVLHPLKIYTMSRVSRFNYMNIKDVTPKNFNKRKGKFSFSISIIWQVTGFSETFACH